MPRLESHERLHPGTANNLKLKHARTQGYRANTWTLRVPNRPDLPVWFFTSTADQVYYYFLAILSTASELGPSYSEFLEFVRVRGLYWRAWGEAIRGLKVGHDLLITYRLDKAHAWYENAFPDAFAGWAGAVNPTYITLSRRAHRGRFVSGVPAESYGSIFSKLRTA